MIETREFLIMIFADQIARGLPVCGFQSIADLDRFLEIGAGRLRLTTSIAPPIARGFSAKTPPLMG